MSRQKDPALAEARHKIDVHVGKQLTALRHASGENQSQIAAIVGMSFQQIQKYERGANRIAASVLYDLATHFSVPVGRFFEGVDDPEAAASIGANIGSSRNGQKLWQLFQQMDPAQQKTLLMTAQAFVPPAGDQQAAA